MDHAKHKGKKGMPPKGMPPKGMPVKGPMMPPEGIPMKEHGKRGGKGK